MFNRRRKADYESRIALLNAEVEAASAEAQSYKTKVKNLTHKLATADSYNATLKRQLSAAQDKLAERSQESIEAEIAAGVTAQMVAAGHPPLDTVASDENNDYDTTPSNLTAQELIDLKKSNPAAYERLKARTH